MHKRTDLSAGALNGSDHLKVELIEPTGKLPFVAITWPTAATITTPAAFDQVAATAMRLLAAASVQLAAIRVHKRLSPQTDLARPCRHAGQASGSRY